MANFEVRVTQGCTVVDWTDPTVITANPAYPSDPHARPTIPHLTRLNAVPGRPARNYQTRAGSGVVVQATPAGEVEGAPDVDLGGKLFSHWFAEKPNGSVAAISHAPGITSIASFVPDIPGNYLLVFYREEGGSLAIPIEVVQG